MLYSRAFIPTLREPPSEAETISHQLMLRAGLIRKLAAGIYDWLPVGLRALKKVEQIIREEMNAVGGSEVWLPQLQPRELWEETGRWPVYGKELMRLKDRKDADFCLAPTAEEVITDLVRREVRSYRSLPLLLYQFGVKYRDEIRPRFGVMRAREFYMKDAYSFHVDESDAGREYQELFQAYDKIFKRCGFRFRPVEAESGAIGGSFSHEFMVLADTGEEGIVSCSCGYAANVERAQAGDSDPCPRCKKPLALTKGIEVGHTFKLGTKYSSSMKAMYLDAQGISKPIVMGCYGIGVSRVVAACIEQCHDADGIIWPAALAPWDLVIVPLNMSHADIKKTAEFLYREAQERGIPVLLDDRDERAGVKLKDADLIGIPLRIAIGERKIAEGKVELKSRARKNPEDIPTSAVLSKAQQWLETA